MWVGWQAASVAPLPQWRGKAMKAEPALVVEFCGWCSVAEVEAVDAGQVVNMQLGRRVAAC